MPAPEVKKTEDQFQEQLIELAHWLHWRVAHFRPAMKKDGQWVTPVAADGQGFPDLLMTRAGRLVVAEIKSEAGKLPPEQAEWLEALAECPAAEVYLWKPSDWSEIVDVLSIDPGPGPEGKKIKGEANE